MPIRACSLPSLACGASATVCASPTVETQLCALLRAAARGRCGSDVPWSTNVEDWDAAMRVVERCREHLRERGMAFNEDTKFGVMLSVPAACLTAEEFVEHGVDFLVVGTNDLTQYTHAADRELASAEHYYRPASSAMKKLITMVLDAAKVRNVPVTICGLAVATRPTRCSICSWACAASR